MNSQIHKFENIHLNEDTQLVQVEKNENNIQLKRQKFHKPSLFDYLIRCALIGAMLLGYYVSQYGFLNMYDEKSFEYFLTRLIFNFLIFITIYSYYLAATIKNPHTSNKIPKKIWQTCYCSNKEYFSNKQCEKCNIWKPTRQSHCSQCKACIPRFDHHCPLTTNCIGFYNHKCFLLFMIYITWGAFVFTIYSYEYFYFDDKTNSFILDISWYIQQIIAFGTIIFCGSILYVQIACLIMGNMTQIDILRGIPYKYLTEIEKLIFYVRGIKLQADYKVNIYDSGLIPNIIMSFGNSYFLWWFPTKNVDKYDCSHFQVNPAPKNRLLYANQASTYNHEDMIEKYNSKFIDDFQYDYAMLFDGKITNVIELVKTTQQFVI